MGRERRTYSKTRRETVKKFKSETWVSALFSLPCVCALVWVNAFMVASLLASLFGVF